MVIFDGIIFEWELCVSHFCTACFNITRYFCAIGMGDSANLSCGFLDTEENIHDMHKTLVQSMDMVKKIILHFNCLWETHTFLLHWVRLSLAFCWHFGLHFPFGFFIKLSYPFGMTYPQSKHCIREG